MKPTVNCITFVKNHYLNVMKILALLLMLFRVILMTIQKRETENYVDKLRQEILELQSWNVNLSQDLDTMTIKVLELEMTNNKVQEYMLNISTLMSVLFKNKIKPTTFYINNMRDEETVKNLTGNKESLSFNNTVIYTTELGYNNAISSNDV